MKIFRCDDARRWSEQRDEWCRGVSYGEAAADIDSKVAVDNTRVVSADMEEDMAETNTPEEQMGKQYWQEQLAHIAGLRGSLS